MSLVLSCRVAVLKEVHYGTATVRSDSGKVGGLSQNFSEAPWILSEKHVGQNILPYTARI